MLNETLLELYQNLRVLEQVRGSAVLEQSGSGILLEHRKGISLEQKYQNKNSEKGLEQFRYVK